jgi:2-polyprenyl-3-methyl-5-hydroxy-6-metoxy-1,4-benzoquinol methylase
MLAERGHEVLAIDLRQPLLDYAASRYTHGDIEFRGANVLEIDTDRRFDLIFANQIIERLVYPEKLVSRALARGRGGGVLSDDRK